MSRPVSSGKKYFLSNTICFHVLVLLLSTFCFISSVFGQAATATLTGTVIDEKGAVIPGASVTIVNVNTQASRQATTSGEGYFVFPLLQPSNYKVSVEGQGFSPVQINDVVLNVGDQKSLQIQLKAGDINAQVTVNSDAETIRTDGGVGTVVNRQFVANMPLNGRSLQALIQLTPGVIITPIGTGSATGGGQFSVNGQRVNANYWMVDGVGANTGVNAVVGFPKAAGSGQSPSTTALGGTNSLVSLDALQEFRIETSSYAPEFGRTPGGQISLLSRSGTNGFHGSASYYFRNEALDANDWFANANNQPKPKERQSLFGGVLGGRVKKDRLFFFGSYEGLRLELPKTTQTVVPTTVLRSQSLPALRPYLNALPLPNGRDFGDGSGVFAVSYSDPGSFDVFALRLDGRVTNSLTGFFRINYAPSVAETRINSLSTVRNIRARNDSYTGGIIWAVPQTTADLRVNWTRNSARSFDVLDSFGGAIVPAVSDIYRPGWDPSLATFRFDVGTGSFSWGGGQDVQRQFNVVGTAIRLISAHQLKFGVDYRRLVPLFGGGSGAGEELRFRPLQSILTATAFSYQLSSNDPLPREAVFSNLSLFAQDTWHVNRRLTLTYGLRFERVPPPTEATGRLPRTALGIESDVLQNPRLAPKGSPLFQSRLGEFAPRFGVAYQLGTRPGWETTLRGGVGTFYDLGLGSIANAFGSSYPFIATKTTRNVPFPLSNAVRTPPVLGVDPPSTLYFLDPNLRLPYTIEWNGTWEQGIGKAQALTIAYVGAAGRKLLINETYFQSLAEFPSSLTALSIQRNLGRSSYNALQLQYHRRLNKGLQVLASYTLGRSRDNGSLDDIVMPATTIGGVLSREYGPSDLDVRHLLSGAVTYEFPKLSEHGVLKVLSEGWGLDLLLRAQSALPRSPEAGLVFSPNGSIYVPRPDVVSGQPFYINDPTLPGGRRFNRAAFTLPASGQQGNFPRNVLRGFPVSQVDLALRREFKIREPIRLQLRAEFFNFFNHPNFGAPVTDIFDPLFGRPRQMLNRSLGGLNALYQIGGPRSAQFAVKVLF
jgi:hypothetical protein